MQKISAEADCSKVSACGNLQHGIFVTAQGRVASCMAFADKFPETFGRSLSDALEDKFYRGVLGIKMSDYLAAQPKCAVKSFQLRISH